MKNFFALLPGFLFCLSAFACECEPLEDFTAYYKTIPFIFEGRVTSIVRNEKEHTIVATLGVKTVHKGKVRLSTIEIFTADNGGQCGFEFELNESYLLFCHNHRYTEPNSGQFETSWCDLNINLKDTIVHEKREKQLYEAEGQVTLEKVMAIQGTWAIDSGIFAHPIYKVSKGITSYIRFDIPCAYLLPEARIEFNNFTGKIYKHDYNSDEKDTCTFHFSIWEWDVFHFHQQGMDYATICSYKEMKENSFIILADRRAGDNDPPLQLRFKRVK